MEPSLGNKKPHTHTNIYIFVCISERGGEKNRDGTVVGLSILARENND